MRKGISAVFRARARIFLISLKTELWYEKALAQGSSNSRVRLRSDPTPPRESKCPHYPCNPYNEPLLNKTGGPRGSALKYQAPVALGRGAPRRERAARPLRFRCSHRLTAVGP
jgi:hypothetical protein